MTTDAQPDPAAIARAALETPVQLPLVFAVLALHGENGGPGVLLVLKTPAAETRTVLTRTQARAMASQLRKVAETGPGLVVPPSGLVVPS